MGPDAVDIEDTCVWIPADLLDACAAEASRAFPLESGGTFMGWWAAEDIAVVNAMIGPGPNADHGSAHFQPDQGWQLEQIARHYEASGRRETYLGDWHSHPRAAHGKLSYTDRKVLRRVISTPAARCTVPLMAIWWGEPGSWRSTVWRAQLRPGIFWNRLNAGACKFRAYTPATRGQVDSSSR